MSTSQPLLQVRGLTVGYGRRLGRSSPVVRGIDLDVQRGEVLAIVGESGSGKSTAVRGIAQLLPATAGTVRFDGQDLTSLSRRELRAKRRDLQMIFQDPYSSLDPAMRILDSVGEPLRVHTSMDARERRTAVVEMLQAVGLREEHADRYPQEFSGGQRQRIAIARALILRPQLLIADEAVSALDVSTQNQVLRLLEDLIAELGIACLFITHDLGVVRDIADRVAVMYLGTVVEVGPTDEVFARPQHPYTQALLSAALIADPVVQRQRRRTKLEGDLPDPTNPPAGCPFHTRCPLVVDRCRTEVPLQRRSGGADVACHLVEPDPDADHDPADPETQETSA